MGESMTRDSVFPIGHAGDERFKESVSAPAFHTAKQRQWTTDPAEWSTEKCFPFPRSRIQGSRFGTSTFWRVAPPRTAKRRAVCPQRRPILRRQDASDFGHRRWSHTEPCEHCRPGSQRHERAVTTHRPQRSTRSQGQSVASQRATASASGTSRLDLSARTQDCTVTSHSSKAEGYR